MPGRPVLAQLLKDVETRGGWEAIYERIENGETMMRIAKTYDVSRTFLTTVMHKDPARKALAQAARKRSAEALVEEAKDITDDVPLDRDAIQKAKLQTEMRTRLAGYYDREQFGEIKPQPTTINIGSLHIDALRAKAPELALLPVKDAELITETAEPAQESAQ